MPKFASPSRPVVVAASTAMVVATSLALLVSSAATAPPAGAAVAPGSTLRGSVQDGSGAGQSARGGDSNVISGDGNSIAFISQSRLDPSLDVGHGESVPYSQVFVRDLVRNRTVMISRAIHVPTVIKLGGEHLLDLNGPRLQSQRDTVHEVPPDGNSYEPTISADGRFVAFVTYASNIVPGADHEFPGIVVCDRDPDGDRIFDEDRTNSDGNVIRDYNCFQVNDRPDRTRVRYGWVAQPRLSADASRIVWQEHMGVAQCSDCGTVEENTIKTETLPLVPGQNQGRRQRSQVQAVDPSVGFFTVVRALFDPAISADGNRIVMRADVSVNPNACDCDAKPWHEILSYDPRDGDTVRVDIDANGEPVGTTSGEMVMRPAVNRDGTVIAFVGEQFLDDSNYYSLFDQPNVYVVTVNYAAEKPVIRSEIVSRNNKGDLVNGTNPALSADGRYLAFTTDALGTHDGVDQRTLDQGEFNCIHVSRGGLTHESMLNFGAVLPPKRDGQARTFCQVVVRNLGVDRDRAANKLSRLPGVLASPGRSTNCTNALPPGDSCAGQNDSDLPSLTADGGRISFDSDANDQVADDTNRNRDVFVRTLEPTLKADTLDFNQVQLGESITRTVQFQEVGFGPLTIETVTLGGTNAADFTIVGQTCQGQTLHEFESCAVTVEFGPRAVGDRSGRLTVRVRGNRTFTADLRGSGTEKPVPPTAAEFKADPSPVEFGQRLPLSPSPDSVVTVTNRGQTPLVISSLTVVGPGTPGDFTITNNGCFGVSVPQNGSCKVSVRYTPQAPGDRRATLRFTHNAPSGQDLIGLHGLAGAPTLEFSPGVTQPGRVVTAIGKGFAPGKKVLVTFPNAIDNATATADANGNFSVPLLIFKKAKPETRTAVATVDGFPAITANATLLIVFPTVSPADFVVRG